MGAIAAGRPTLGQPSRLTVAKWGGFARSGLRDSIIGMNTSVPAESRRGQVLVADLAYGVIEAVGDEMSGQPASMVRELLDETLARRLPGIAIDDDRLSLMAARISVGLSPA